jgi:hypothetical protein
MTFREGTTMNWELIFELVLLILRIVSAGQAD